VQDNRESPADAAGRLDALRRRSAELAERLLVLQSGRPSAAGDLHRAQAARREAVEHSLAADRRRELALLRAASAHDRAALAHERAARAGTGDPDRHAACAAHHRDAAQADRRLAEHPRPDGCPAGSG